MTHMVYIDDLGPVRSSQGRNMNQRFAYWAVCHAILSFALTIGACCAANVVRSSLLESPDEATVSVGIPGFQADDPSDPWLAACRSTSARPNPRCQFSEAAL